MVACDINSKTYMLMADTGATYSCINDGPDSPHIQYQFMLWKPWLQTLHPYKAPLDELHCTLNYLTQPDELYDQAWQEEVNSTAQQLQITSIFAGKEGVAACCLLT